MEPRSLIGKGIDAIPTPALLVDADALEHNLARMAAYFAERPAKLRPHFKSHKCVALAKRQLAAGHAVGITCAKLSEAEVLVAGGIADVLVANQVVGADKARRLAALNREAIVRAAADSAENVAELGRAAAAAGVALGLLVEVDIGMKRCGVPAGKPAVGLAREIHETDGLRLDGLQGYEGHLVMLPDPEERRRKTVAAMAPLLATRAALGEAGLPCPIVSGGGTGTYDVTGDLEGIDEIQAGSYALMDCHYRKRRPEFECALSVLAAVISARPNAVILDVGLKGMGNEFGLPVVEGAPNAKVLYVAEEHAAVEGVSAPVGSRMCLTPSHGCTTCNLHRRLWIIRDGAIEDVWPIEGRGQLE